MSSRTVTARARTRSRELGRPIAQASRDTATMATARSTEGSQRVRMPKKTSTPAPATSRPPIASLRNRGATRARTKARFSPDTTRR